MDGIKWHWMREEGLEVRVLEVRLKFLHVRKLADLGTKALPVVTFNFSLLTSWEKELQARPVFAVSVYMSTGAKSTDANTGTHMPESNDRGGVLILSAEPH